MKQINIYETEWYPVLEFQDPEYDYYKRYAINDEEYEELVSLKDELYSARDKLKIRLTEIVDREDRSG